MPEEIIRIVSYETSSENPASANYEGVKTALGIGGQPYLDMELKGQSEDSTPQKVDQKMGEFKAYTNIPVEKFEQEMEQLMAVVDRLLRRTEHQTEKKSGMQLDEIELSIEINSQGQFSIIGTGAQVGGKGGIKLKFKRAESK